ncbi:MAG: hypothetical protein H7X88_13045 [Gloeobacteraceae cyanobacterium ES-bin-316]|nr:hypothetical protein [Ferruginibacter sp.]
MQDYLANARWQHSKKRAELVNGDQTIIEIDFTHKNALVKFSDQQLKIIKEGFWSPKIASSKGGAVISRQKPIGVWGTKNEFVLDNEVYLAQSRQGTLYQITYYKNDIALLTYKLDTLKGRSVVTFEIKSRQIPQNHLLIFLALGFYSIKAAALESLSDDFMISAVA